MPRNACAPRLEGKGVAGEAIGQRPDKDIVFAGHGLQALGGVHRVAGHGIGFCTDRTEAAGDDRAAIDADMQTQRHAGACVPALANLRRPTDHIQCGTERPDRIVLMSDRRAEQRQQRIADELVDEAAIGFDRLGHLFEQFVLQHPHDFRVDLLAQSREAAEIGKEHGHRPPVGVALRFRQDRLDLRLRCGLRCAWYRRTTSGAEGKIGLTRMAAGSTGEWLLCAASRTESKTALNIEPAAAALHRTHLTKPRCTAISAATSRPQTGDKHEPAAPGPQALNKRRIW